MGGDPHRIGPHPDMIDLAGLKYTTSKDQLAEILVPDKEALKREVANRDGWLNELENGLETGSEGRGAPKKLPQAIWDEHEAFKKRVEEYCA